MVTILDIINDSFNGILGHIPTRNTIENWVKKCGFDIYNSPEVGKETENYAMIVDESMMIGSQKLLLTLGIPSQHQARPLTPVDVSILDMAVSSSWNSEGVKQRLLMSSDKTGRLPEYVISDNASIMKGGISQAGLVHHRDISHSLGMFLERNYKKDADFIAYTKSMSQAQFKHNMKKTAYLLPPRQRTIARFINLSNWVQWSEKMLNIYPNLTPEERAVFAFVPANASLIDELSDVMKCINEIEKDCKKKGLSKEVIKECKRKIQSSLFKGNDRMRTLGQAIFQFLQEEQEILDDDRSIHNNSSDIVETIFGIYKHRKSPNKLYGVTSFILFMSAYTKLSSKEYAEESLIKKHLENVKLRQIQEWARTHLTENLVEKRIKTLKRAG